MDEISTETNASARRKLLKAGVAAGTVAAVWGTPGIRGLGTVPAYATHCTGPVLLTSEKLNANCNSGCPDYVSYASASAKSVYTLGGGGLTGTLTFTAGKCSTNAPYTIAVAGYTCLVSSVNVSTSKENFDIVTAGVLPVITRDGNRCSAELVLTVKCCPVRPT